MTGPIFNNIAANAAGAFKPKTTETKKEKESTSTQQSITPEKGGEEKLLGQQDAQASLNRAMINKPKSFDINAIKAKFGDLDKSTNDGLTKMAKNPNILEAMALTDNHEVQTTMLNEFSA